MSYYHGLGGYKNMVNQDILKDKDYYASSINIPKSFMATTEPISLYRLSNILKTKKIKCKNSLPLDIHNYDYNGYDKNSVYLGVPTFTITDDCDKGFEDWAGFTISLKIKDTLQNDFNLLSPFENYINSISSPVTVEGEVRVKKAIPLSYVDAICVPIYTEILYLLSSFNRKIGNSSEELGKNSYFVDKQRQINLILKMLEDNHLEIPIEETYTGEYLTDVSSIIEELVSIPSCFLPDYIEEKRFIIYRSLYHY